jgi:hypothetical protein
MSSKPLPYNLLCSRWFLITGMVVTLLDSGLIVVAPYVSWCTMSTRESYEIPCSESDDLRMRMHYLLLSIGLDIIWIGPAMLFAAFVKWVWMARGSLSGKEDDESV